MADEKNEVKVDASALQVWRDCGDHPESLSDALDEILTQMESKDGTQELTLTVTINNDLEPEEDDEDEDEESESDDTETTSKEG